MQLRRALVLAIFSLAIAHTTTPASAIGWDGDDFLIGGGPSFGNKIGVFNHDLTFKGLLEPSFLTVGGMDFDGNGNLVAVAGELREVRVYAPSGVRVGGFVRQDDALRASGDLRVAVDGTYLIGQGDQFGADGTRQFTPQGDFIRQFGGGRIDGIVIVPGNRLWNGVLGSSSIAVFDIATGEPAGTLAVAGLNGVEAMSYSAVTGTVLIADALSSRIFETDLGGGIVRTFQSPFTVAFRHVTRGPNGDVLATAAGGFGHEALRWRADGTFVGSFSTEASIGRPRAIVWAGAVPEPGAGLAVLIAGPVLFRRTRCVELGLRIAG